MPHGIASSDDEATKGYVGKLVAKTVEETPNALPDEEADQLVNAGRQERTGERQAYGGGRYRRRLVTGAGEVEPSVPKLRGATSATKIIERYRRRESSVEEAMMEACLAGVSTRGIEDAGEIPWGSSASKGTVSNLNQKAFAKVEERRTRPPACAYPYACVDGACLKRNWGGAYESVAVLIATGANEDGCREVIGCAEGYTESAGSWREFLLSLRDRGLRGVRMVTGDKSAGMVGALAEVFPEAPCQRCAVHFHRNALSRCRPVAGRGSPPSPRPSTPRSRWERAPARPRRRPASWSRRGRRTPRRRSAGAWRRRSPTRGSRWSTGGRPGRATGSRGSTARSRGAPTRSAASPTGGPR